MVRGQSVYHAHARSLGEWVSEWMNESETRPMWEYTLSTSTPPLFDLQNEKYQKSWVDFFARKTNLTTYNFHLMQFVKKMHSRIATIAIIFPLQFQLFPFRSSPKT